MPAVSFSQLDFIVRKSRDTPSDENKNAAVDALLSFAIADNPRQRIKASTLLPEFHEICAHRQGNIHEAIFDLCEDPLEHVRIAGYHAIVDLSKRASSVRRKNADVLCQLLQSEGASELAVVRGCLSQHVRTAPETTYNIIAEYLVTNNGTKYARGPLMGVILSFLAGGGLGHSWVDSPISSNEAVAAFCQRDVEGGKGALMEVSWLQKSATADATLRKCLISALSCATLEEARTITSSILFCLSSECTPLGKDATDLLRNIVQISSTNFNKEITQTPTTMSSSLGWLDLGASTVTPVVSPVPSFEPDPTLPRADPTPLLEACRGWILPSIWSKYSQQTQVKLTTILGTALRASRSILLILRRSKDGHGTHLVSKIVAARNAILDSVDHVIQSWIDSGAYNGNKQTCQAMLEFISSISERKTDSGWSLSFDQSTRLQNLRKSILNYAGGADFNVFRDLLQCIDATLASPNEMALSQTNTNPPSPVLPATPEVTNDVASRKRLRKELEAVDVPNQSNQPAEERSLKRQKVVRTDILTRINRHRSSAIPAGTPRISAAPPMERDPDNPMKGIENPKAERAVDGTPVATGLSIKGAAATKSPEQAMRPLQTPHAMHAGSVAPGELPGPPPINREPSISSALQTLRIQPASSSSLNPIGGTHPQPSPQSQPEIQDSVKRLLLGKVRDAAPAREKDVHPSPKPLPRSSLLERIEGIKATSSLPPPQPQTPTATIFDRMGIPPKVIGANFYKKRGV